MKTEDEVDASSSVASAATRDRWAPRTSSIEAMRFRTELNASGECVGVSPAAGLEAFSNPRRLRIAN